jgi:hypothetical protein
MNNSECNVCFERKPYLTKCSNKCTFDICIDCYQKITQKKCPQCNFDYEYTIVGDGLRHWFIKFKTKNNLMIVKKTNNRQLTK